MIRISCLIIIRLVATGTGIRRVVVVAIVTSCTIIGNAGVGAVQGVIVVVDGERSRRPAGRCMAVFTIGRNANCLVVRICTLIVIYRMAGYTFGRSAGETIGMAIDTSSCQVRPGQREVCGVVVKRIIGISGRVTGKTGRIKINIPVHAGVLIVRLRVGVAICAGKFHVIRRISMAIRTCRPFSLVLSTVNWEILVVVIKS